MATRPNILITSAGRRVELVRAFQKALAEVGGGLVVASDCDSAAPALQVADRAELSPRLSLGDEKYLVSLEAIIGNNDISLVVPTIDTELPLLARWRGDLETRTGARILVSSQTCIEICADKRLTAHFFAENAIPSAETFDRDDALSKVSQGFPLIVKPAFGSSSKDVFVATNRRELEFFLDYVGQPIVQQKLDGQEWTIDALLDFDSQDVAVVTRRRIAVRAGEILRGEVVHEPKILEPARRLLETLGDIGAIGPITMQGFLCGDGEFRFTEINPRFGGGAPMSFAAGADFPAWLCRKVAGLPPPPLNAIRSGVRFSRFDSTIETTTLKNKHPSNNGRS